MSKAQDFLVEIGTEELPPKALRPLDKAFAAGVAARLQTLELASEALSSFASPRRLAILIRGLQLSLSEAD